MTKPRVTLRGDLPFLGRERRMSDKTAGRLAPIWIDLIERERRNIGAGATNEQVAAILYHIDFDNIANVEASAIEEAVRRLLVTPNRRRK